jgi:hypothetical protein
MNPALKIPPPTPILPRKLRKSAVFPKKYPHPSQPHHQHNQPKPHPPNRIALLHSSFHPANLPFSVLRSLSLRPHHLPLRLAHRLSTHSPKSPLPVPELRNRRVQIRFIELRPHSLAENQLGIRTLP